MTKEQAIEFMDLLGTWFDSKVNDIIKFPGADYDYYPSCLCERDIVEHLLKLFGPDSEEENKTHPEDIV